MWDLGALKRAPAPRAAAGRLVNLVHVNEVQVLGPIVILVRRQFPARGFNAGRKVVMSNSILAAQVRARVWMMDIADRLRSSEKGQGATEYAGAIVVAVVVVVALIGAAKGWNVGERVKEKIDKIFE